ncbi:MAG: hypothetical protein ACLTSZ_19350 [Lachnospiraceae bacterium]
MLPLENVGPLQLLNYRYVAEWIQESLNEIKAQIPDCTDACSKETMDRARST